MAPTWWTAKPSGCSKATPTHLGHPIPSNPLGVSSIYFPRIICTLQYTFLRWRKNVFLLTFASILRNRFSWSRGTKVPSYVCTPQSAKSSTNAPAISVFLVFAQTLANRPSSIPPNKRTTGAPARGRIVGQGPTHSTLEHWWAMIWEYQVLPSPHHTPTHLPPALHPKQRAWIRDVLFSTMNKLN